MTNRPELEWIPTGEVQAGDRIACLLSDAEAFPVVTGWADKTIDLTRYDLPVYMHRVFTVQARPWWADDMTTFDLAGEALIVKRGAWNGTPGILGGGCAGCEARS